MKIEKSYFKVSLKEMAAMIFFALLLVNGIMFLFSLLIGISFTSVFQSTWFISIVYPVGHGVIQSIINKNGVMVLSQFDDLDSLREQLEHSAGRIGYKITYKDNTTIKFNRKATTGRFMNFLFGEDFKVVLSDDRVEIFGKRNALVRIERRVTYLK